jgi:hypothetical protein
MDPADSAEQELNLLRIYYDKIIAFIIYLDGFHYYFQFRPANSNGLFWLAYIKKGLSSRSISQSSR